MHGPQNTHRPSNRPMPRAAVLAMLVGLAGCQDPAGPIPPVRGAAQVSPAPDAGPLREREDAKRLRRELRELGFYSGLGADEQFLVTLTDDQFRQFAEAVHRIQQAPADFPPIAVETDSPRLDAEHVRALRGQPAVGGFIFRRVPINAELAAALTELKGLRTLELDQVAIRAEAAQLLGRLPSLTTLKLANVDGGRPVLRAMQSVGTLRVLRVRWPFPGEALLPSIAELPQLTELELWDLTEQAGDPRRLAALKNLESLEVRNSSWTTEEFSFLADLKNLVRLVVRSDVPLGDGFLSAVDGHARLKTLSVWNTEFTNQGLETLSRCPALEQLDLRRSRIDDRGLVHLAALSNLKSLSLEYSHVSGAGLATAELPAGLQTISIEPALVRTQDLQNFPKPVHDVLRAGLSANVDNAGAVRIWNVSNAATEMMGAAAYEPRGPVTNDAYLAAVSSQDVAFFNLKTGQFVKRFDLAAFNVPPWAVGIASDGQTIALAQTDSVLVLDVDSRDTVVRMPWKHDRTSMVVFSPDGRHLAAASERATTVWSLPDGRVVQEIAGARPTFSARSTFIAAPAAAYRLGENEPFYTLRAGAFHAKFLDDHILLVDSSGSRAETPWALERHNVAERKLVDRIELPAGRIGDCWAVSPDGKWIAKAEGRITKTQGQTVAVYDLATGRRIATINAGAGIAPPFAVESLVFIGSGRVAGSVRRVIFVD